jgi:chemotaxis protein MotB
MARKKKEECPPLPIWMTTFSDLMSLLLTFFVLLFSMSSISREKFIKFIQTLEFMWGIEIIKQKTPPAPTQPPVSPPIQTNPKPEKWSSAIHAAEKARKLLAKSGIPAQSIQKEKEIVLRIPADNLFQESSYKPQREFIPLLKKICDILQKLKLPIRIEGHTDNKPIYKYPEIVDNWDLSLLRAITVAKQFITWGFPEDKISVAGYADTEPVAPNDTPQNRAKNRRIDIVIFVGSQKL